MPPNQITVSFNKWKLIQFAELDLFEDTNEELKMIGMNPLDIRLFRDWQKGRTTLKQTEIGENKKGEDF